jgi:hypothetical protein
MAAPMKKCACLKIFKIKRISSISCSLRHYNSISPRSLDQWDCFLLNYEPCRSPKAKILPKSMCSFTTTGTVCVTDTDFVTSDPVSARCFSKMYENVAFLETIPTESDISCSSQRVSGWKADDPMCQRWKYLYGVPYATKYIPDRLSDWQQNFCLRLLVLSK